MGFCHCERSEASVAKATDPHLQIHNQANQTMRSLKVRFCIMDLRSVRHEILANLSQ
ncbi:hypothetical protein [Helicobacter rodentium]|uniref:hypothetical protein n=1 Tax=Helicobacter rodentium TaxID=59617 RepID=UPI0025A5E93C|nr:hypothetical protein [Helicobacter rodentium]